MMSKGTGMKVEGYGQAKILTDQEVRLLFEEGLTSPRDRALFGICLYCATRVSEACSLFRKDIIGKQGVRERLVIRAFNTKGGQHTREIDVHPQLREYLEEYRHYVDEESKYLFPGRRPDTFLCRQSAHIILRDICDELGIEGVSTHSFRRTALTRMSDAGIPLRHIQSISGHKTLAALERYLGVTEAQKREAIEQLNF